MSRTVAGSGDHYDPITLREYLTFRVLLDGADVWTAIEAVASTLLSHPEWDADEVKYWDEWAREEEASS